MGREGEIPSTEEGLYSFAKNAEHLSRFQMEKVQLNDTVIMYDSKYFIETSLPSPFPWKVQITSYPVLVAKIVILVKLWGETGSYFYLTHILQQLWEAIVIFFPL